MASLVAFGTGTTAATATLVSPPGKVTGALGPKFTVIDSISFTASSTAGCTAGIIELQNNGVGQGRFLEGLRTTANSTFAESWEFPQGLLVPHVSAGSVEVLAAGVTGADQSRVIVTYHFESNQP
jgi:hypothetical protein